MAKTDGDPSPTGLGHLNWLVEVAQLIEVAFSFLEKLKPVKMLKKKKQQELR
jgi:hypothetical protein